MKFQLRKLMVFAQNLEKEFLVTQEKQEALLKENCALSKDWKFSAYSIILLKQKKERLLQ